MDKAFLWHVVNYFSPEFVQSAVNEANKLRIEARREQDENKKPL